MKRGNSNRGFIYLAMTMVMIIVLLFIIIGTIIMFFNGQLEYRRNMNGIYLYDAPNYESVEKIKNINPFNKNEHDIFIKYRYNSEASKSLKEFFIKHNVAWDDINKSMDFQNNLNEGISNIKNGYIFFRDDYEIIEEHDKEKNVAILKNGALIGKTISVFDCDNNELYFISYTFKN